MPSSPIELITDEEAGFEILPDFERFHQQDDVFRRSWWDNRIRNKKSELFYRTYREPLAAWRKVDGYTQKDYALRNASWHVSDLFTEYREAEDRREGFTDEFSLQREPAQTRTELGTPAAAAVEIKRVASAFGADLVGITHFDERWVYVEKFSDGRGVAKPQELPAGLTSVIVIAQAMDYDLVRTAPSALSGAATGLGYSYDAMVLLSLAQYIRNLGYRAVASMNDTALAVPLAIKAGLGEYGRHGLLITRDFGPRVRLGKVFTDLPLAYDRPVRFGVREFCTTCRRCADGCPVRAISRGAPTAERLNQSTIRGVRKWSIDGEKCFELWTKQNSDCTICIRVCPWNKEYRHWLYRLGRRLAATRLRRFMLWLDERMGYGRRTPPISWWEARGERMWARVRDLFKGGARKRYFIAPEYRRDSDTTGQSAEHK